jgi:hypothetical protein
LSIIAVEFLAVDIFTFLSRSVLVIFKGAMADPAIQIIFSPATTGDNLIYDTTYAIILIPAIVLYRRLRGIRKYAEEFVGPISQPSARGHIEAHAMTWAFSSLLNDTYVRDGDVNDLGDRKII